MANLKAYLTSLQPDMEQTIPSQSIGGYISNSLLYPEALVNGTIGLYDLSFSLGPLSMGSWSDWANVEFININSEIMKVYPITDNNISVIQRGFNNIIESHIYGDMARAVSAVNLFNDVFNDNYKQYRCIAVKNDALNIADPSLQQNAANISVHIRQNSRNLNSNIKIAIEKPIHQYIQHNTGSIVMNSNTGITQLIDTSLANQYEDDFFRNSYLKIGKGINKNQGRIISSFKSSTGTFTLNGSLSNDSDISYEIFPSPARRVRTGTISPELNSSNITTFSSATKEDPIRINFNDEEDVSIENSYLNTNDIFYIWLERTITKGSSYFNNNDIVINMEYIDG